MIIPTPMTIVNKIVMENGRFNGHNTLLDAFLSVLPESSKDEQNDNYIENLYYEVERNMLSKSATTDQSIEQWALLN